MAFVNAMALKASRLTEAIVCRLALMLIRYPYANHLIFCTSRADKALYERQAPE